MICDAKYWQVDAPQNAAQQVFPTCPLPGPCPAAAEIQVMHVSSYAQIVNIYVIL